MILLALLLLVVVIPPTIALAGTQFNYATGVNGVNGEFPTDGFAARDYNQVWHQSGTWWVVWYKHTDGSTNCVKNGTANPTRCPDPSSYAQAWCGNLDDNSGVQWTCQTTRP